MRIPGVAVLLLSLLCLSPRIASAQETWMNYGQANEITDIAVRGDYIWCATTNGLVRWDKRDMSYRKYTMRDGLPHHIINAIDIAPDGSVWCATEAGVARFDGNDWQVFKEANGAALVTAAPDGSIWVGTSKYKFLYFESRYRRCEGGVLRYKDGTWTSFGGDQMISIVTPFLPYQIYCPVTSIAIAPDSTVVFGSDCKGVGRYVNGIFEQWYDGGAMNGVTTANNTVWAWAGIKIYKHEGNTWNSLSLPTELPFKNISSLAIQPDGKLWAGTESGVLRYDGTAWKRYTAADGLPSDVISSLALDDSGVLWIGTSGGLCSFDGTSFRPWKTEDELIDKKVTSLAFEPNGTVWAGTSSGLSRYDGKSWRSFTIKNGLPDNTINGITVAPNGDVWIATPKGAARYYGSGWKVYTIANGLPDNRINNISVTPQGDVWIATPNGAARFNGSWKVYTTADGLPDNNIYTIVAGKDNSVWFSLNNQVTRFDGTIWKTYTEDDGLLLYYRDTKVYAEYSVMPDGTVWAATNASVARFDGERWTNVDPGAHGYYISSLEAGLDNKIYYVKEYISDGDMPYYSFNLFCYDGSLKELGYLGRNTSLVKVDKNGVIWAGHTAGSKFDDPGGLRIEGDSQTLFTEVDGLAYRTIHSLIIAPDGATWFLTDRGLSRYGLPMIVGVESEPALPREFAIVSNSPNPFNPSTTISFTLPRSVRAELMVYSITGQKIRTILSGPLAAGAHSAVWDGRDDSGKTVSSGVYLSRLSAGKQAATGKMLMMK